MKAGLMDTRVQHKTRTTTQDGYGQPTSSWTVAATYWAQFDELRSKEFFEANARQIEVTSRFRMRYFALSYSDRLTVDGVDYEPVQIITLGRKSGLEILAKRVEGNQRDA